MAGISRDIVIVNEFTVNGSRGNSPGNYILEYMARDKASENLTPTTARPDRIAKMERQVEAEFLGGAGALKAKGRVSDYVTRYMARDTATELLSARGDASSGDLRSEIDGIQGMSGIAFSQDDLSLSHDDVKKRSKRIQAEYEKGKPVLKTVISFDTDYLKRMGVLPEDLEVRNRGDLYGKSDQAKLRIAIQRGMRNIRHGFSDLDWVGVIQVDTKHLHCHLAMVDRGPGKRFTKKGEQKGMLDDAMKLAIRRGIDNSLSECQLIKPLSIQMESERRNTVSFIKRFTHKILEERGLPQYLLACLPKDDKSLWKASVNTDGGPENEMTVYKGKSAKKIKGNMKKANEITRSYVIDLLNRPESGFAEAMKAKHEYLEAQRDRGDYDHYRTYKTRGTGKSKKSVLVELSPDEAVRDLEDKYREEVIARGMNAVYDVLRGIDDKDVTLHTPLLDAMGMPYPEMANYVKEDKLIEFGFRLRSYAGRLDYHKKAYESIGKVVHAYEDGDQATYNPESKSLYEFMKTEQEYNHALMCKYQTFLHFYHVKDEYEEDHEELMALRHRSYARRAMKADKSLVRGNDPEKAEKKGQETYGLRGASYLITGPEMFDSLAEAEDKEYARRLRNFKERLATMGMLYDEDGDDISKGLAYGFDEVKAYDLHHMSYDFTYDFKIASENVDNFARMANARYDAYMKAKGYIEKTGQEEALAEIVNVDDILIAKQLADDFREDRTYRTKFDDSGPERHNAATIRLDDEAYDRLGGKSMAASMRDVIRQIDEEEPEGPSAYAQGQKQ